MRGILHLGCAALAALLAVALLPAVLSAETRTRVHEDADTALTIAAISDAFATQLRGRTERGITGLDDAAVADAIEELRGCLQENELSLLASTALDPDMLNAAPAVLLARLLRNRDEPVHTCVLYRIQSHRVGIDPTPPLVAAFQRVLPDALDAAELSLADPRDLGELAIALPPREQPPRAYGPLRYCLTLPRPGAYVVTFLTPEGRELRELARYYEATDATVEPRGGCSSAVAPGPEGSTCLRLYYAGRRGEEGRTETCFDVRGFEPPSPASGP